MALERRKRPRGGIVSQLGWLQRLGEPVEVTELPAEYKKQDYLLRLRTDTGNPLEIELEAGAESLEWYDEWLIMGCFISYTIKRFKFDETDELTDASREGLKKLLEVRLRQVQRDGLRA